MAVEIHTEMTCSTRFLSQCKLWTVYGTCSAALIVIASIVLLYAGSTGWDLLFKILLVWSCVTCTIWYIWVMKKIYDIANWWINLHQSIDRANQLLLEARADLKDIKRLAAPAS